MMKIKNLGGWLLATCFCVGTILPLGAQSKTGATVKFPELGASWRVEYRYAGEQDTKEGGMTVPEARSQLGLSFLRWENYSVDGDVALIEKHFDDGSSRTTYVVNGRELAQDLRTGKIRSRVFEGKAGKIEVAGLFPRLDWITPASLVGEVEKLGQKCQHYRREFSPPVDPRTGQPDGTPLVCEAWIATATRFPVAYQEAGREWRFVFLGPLRSSINIPEDLKRELRRVTRP